MKRSIIFLLLLIYSVSVSGTAFHLHFCGSYLQSVSFAGTEHKGCCCGKTEMPENCCADKTVVFKSDDDHKESVFITIDGQNHASVPVFFPEVAGVAYQPQLSTALHSFHSPPVGSGMCKLHVLNCVFRI
jgi:hypothetical protein